MYHKYEYLDITHNEKLLSFLKLSERNVRIFLFASRDHRICE